MTAEDKYILRTEVKKELRSYKELINKSPDLSKTSTSLMMDPKLLELKNEIQKKVIYYKKRHRDLPEFVRVKKAAIIADREEIERKE